jgi:hypothetical protein
MSKSTSTTTPEVTPELTETEALAVVVRGVNREGRRDASQCKDLLHDACALRGQNVRKLATVAEAKGKLTVGFESYLSYMSNAAGVAAMFEWDTDAIDAFLADTKWGLRGLFNAFRELFGPAKPVAEGDGEGDAGETGEPTPLIEVVLSALPHLTADERQQVAAAIIALDTAEDDAAEAA